MLPIRQASPADIEALIALSRRMIRASYGPLLGREVVEAFIGSGAVDQYVTGHIEDGTVIVADDALVGYAVCKSPMIDLMMIDQPHHRRGFGTRLLRHCEGLLFAHYDTLTLESFADNHQANHFSTNNGWAPADRYVDAASGVHKVMFRTSAPYGKKTSL